MRSRTHTVVDGTGKRLRLKYNPQKGCYVKAEPRKQGYTFYTSYYTEQEFLELHGLGLSDSDMAKELGVKKKTVRKRRERLGLPENP